MSRRLTPEDVARRPIPGGGAPSSVAFSPDGTTLTFLAADPGDLRQRLVAVDVATGARREIAPPGVEVDEATLTIEEQLQRERARELGTGITRYRWAAQGTRMLIPMSDGLWILDDLDAEPRLEVATDNAPGPISGAALSDDGSRIVFVAAGEVHVAEAAGGAPVQVTCADVGSGRTNGMAEFVAQEEMGRDEGCWLSPGATRVAFCEVDETHIPVYRIVHQGSDAVPPQAQEDHRYPFAGAENARVRLGVVPADGSGAEDPRWLDLGCTGIGDDRYLARVTWVDDDHLVAQILTRDQRRLDVVRYDVGSGEGTLLWSETSDVWVNLHDSFRVLDDGSYLWLSERSGFAHLEVRDASGQLRHQLTSGEWVVTGVVAVRDGWVYLTGTRRSPLERHLYRVRLDGSGDLEELTRSVGLHQPSIGPDGTTIADVWSGPRTPPQLDLRVGGASTNQHDGGGDPRVGELDLDPPELREVTAADGRTTLHAAVYRPAGEGPFPTVIWTYGGPHAQLVTASWSLTAALRAQYLRDLGFCVAVADGRGSTNRGLAFEGVLRHRLGTVEVDDQVRLVETLVDDGLADPDRVGIYGWSYGGYLSALCLARRPDVFRAACAGAPVTAWDGYDTCYTERYLGTPTENPDGYRHASVMTHVEGLRDRALLLIHGLIDENVHFRHTARLITALHTAGIDHRLVLYPGERHVPRRAEDRAAMERTVAEFFRSALGA